MSKFAAAELLQPSLSGNLAAPAGDSICNLLKYALAMEPKTNATSFPTTPALVNGLLTLTYSRAIMASDLTCTVEATATLGGQWTSDTNSLLQAAIATNGTAYTIQAQDLTGTNQFMRIRVTRP